MNSQPIIIKKLVPGGQGLATLPDGKKAFFWNALPGEEVLEYEVTKKKSKYIEAVATKLDRLSPHRVTPKDPCYLSTSPWQIMDYDYELAMKRELLIESLRQESIRVISKGASEVVQSSFVGVCGGYDRAQAPLAHDDGPSGRAPTKDGLHNFNKVSTDMKDYYYRNKMEYSLYYDHSDEKIHLAFHRRGSHGKIPIEKSSIERPEIFKKAQEIIADLNARGEEARKYQSLLLRCNQNGEVSGGLYENNKPHPVFDNLTDIILGHEYSYSPNGFFQINLPVYEMALKEIKKHITSEKVLDLYAGVGTIGLSVARDKDLTLVEVDKSAYRELEKNCKTIAEGLGRVAPSGALRSLLAFAPWDAGAKRRHSGRDPVKTGVANRGDTGSYSPEPCIAPIAVLSRSENALDYITSDETVILDPPRAGIDKKLTSRLLEALPETIVYLSCNPSTQARDLRLLTESRKYKITLVQPFNFFPRTPHLENLAILRRS